MDEKRLWGVVFGLLALALVLVFSAFQFAWFTVAVDRGDSLFETNFYLGEYKYGLYVDGDANRIQSTESYDDDMDLGTVMGVTQALLMIGILGVVGFAGALGLYYMGTLTQTRWLYLAWGVTVAALVLAVLFFSFTVANAADNDARQIAADVGVSLSPQTKVHFWDTEGQHVGFGEMVSSPGSSWFLLILGLLNVLGSTLVLFRFPAGDESSASVGA